MKRVYLDNAATTPLDPRVIETMTDAMKNISGNPSSIHADGRIARAAIERARRLVAKTIGASIGEVFFTSGGTESNNTAIKCAVRDLGVNRLITSRTEHHCVLHCVKRLQKEGKIELVYLPLDKGGRPNFEHLEDLLTDKSSKTLVSLMHSNNEIGTMIDLKRLAHICEEGNAFLHSDTVQTMGYIPINVNETPLQFLSGSAHKFYGPKGAGFLYINAEHKIEPYVDGGAQERNMRAGTENIYGIVGLARALELAIEEQDTRREKIESVRSHLYEQLNKNFEGIIFPGDLDHGHFKVLNVAFPSTPTSDLLLVNLDIAGFSVSGGSACSSGSDIGSHVIQALNIPDDYKAIRCSFSHHNTIEEMDRLIATLKDLLPELVKSKDMAA